MRILESEFIDSRLWSELVKQSSVATWFQTEGIDGVAGCYVVNSHNPEELANSLKKRWLLKGKPKVEKNNRGWAG